MNTPDTSKSSNAATQELITKKEVARRLHVTERSIDNYSNKGVIKRLKLGALSRYDWHDVVASIKNQQTNG